MGAIILEHIKNIEEEINFLRERLNALIENEKTGEIDISKQTLEISKKLDKLILEYYKDKDEKN